jgi:hypothetical protein
MTPTPFKFSILIGVAILAAGFAKVASAQDVAAGERTFNVCRACHEIGDGAKNLVGPVLNGVVGRKSGSYPGYPTRMRTRIPASPGTRQRSRNTLRIQEPKFLVPKCSFRASRQLMTSSTLSRFSSSMARIFTNRSPGSEATLLTQHPP